MGVEVVDKFIVFRVDDGDGVHIFTVPDGAERYVPSRQSLHMYPVLLLLLSMVLVSHVLGSDDTISLLTGRSIADHLLGTAIHGERLTVLHRAFYGK